MTRSDRQEWSRMKNINPHYVIAGLIFVVGLVLFITIALSFIGIPLMILGILWAAVARWMQKPKHEPGYSGRT